MEPLPPLIDVDPSTDFTAGCLLLVDKPLHWTSFDVVAKLRGLISSRAQPIKVGHAGTLDPLATGLLLICTGQWTKRIEALQNSDKRYIATIQFGATTPSYDAEFPPEHLTDCQHLTIAAVEEALGNFRGAIEQMPPAFSAIKVNGQTAYSAARKGKTLELQPRKVNIFQFDVLAHSFDDPTALMAQNHLDPSNANEQLIHAPRIQVIVHCSKGTYIRSLAHDLGQQLKVGAYLAALERTAIGEYHLDQSKPLAEWIEALQTRKGLIGAETGH
jgi:tRNA pseudouridine55 synthase